MTVGERIRHARKERGMTQYELAALCDMPQHAISKYENNIWDPRLFNATSIAIALDVSLDWLVGLSDEEV